MKLIFSRKRLSALVLLAFMSVLLSITGSWACSEICIEKQNVSARNFDFMTGDGEAVLSPRGIIRRSTYVKGTPLVWLSRYGSLSFNAVLCGTADGEKVVAGVDGINEKGLKIGTYFLESSEFAEAGNLPSLSITSLPQYLLDNFSTVDEVITDLRRNSYRVVSVPTAVVTIKLHLFIHDAEGESAIVEFLDGKVVFHRNPKIAVLTNTAYNQAISDLANYRGFGGEKEIPGANESMDRFVRGAFYFSHLPEPGDKTEAIKWGFATVQILSVAPMFPHGCTRWTIVSDMENRQVFFRTLENPNVSYVDLKKADLSPGQRTKSLDFQQENLNGDVTGLFRNKS